MKNDILILDAHVIDPARNINKQQNVRIIGSKIIDEQEVPITQNTLIIDAKDYIVTPGLIDYHAHVYYDGTEGGVRPDIYMIPNGITTVVDGGSAGTANFDAFYRNVICNSKVRIKSFVTISRPGQTWCKENYDPEFFDIDKLESLFEEYPDTLQGIKIKIQTEDTAQYGIPFLTKSFEIAETLSCRLAAHVTNPMIPTNEFIKFFRKGDIIAHAFHGKGSTILDNEGHVIPEILEARERGVIFDAANGRSHFSMKTAQHAIADKFLPDVISSDLSTITKLAWPVYALPWILSKYIALGMSLVDIVARCTANPAKLLNMENEIGTLAPGAYADVALFKLKNKSAIFEDIHGNKLNGQSILVPQMTIKSGEILFRQIDF